MYGYTVRLRFDRVRCKFLDVDGNCVSLIKDHPCNVDKLLSDGRCLRSFCSFGDGSDELVELIAVHRFEADAI
jgi:hypothetical protein